MSGLPTDVKLDIDRRLFDKLLKETPTAINMILEVGARNIERKAKDRVAVDTGATKNSIRVVDSGLLARRISGRIEKRVGPSTSYAPHIELGTSRMSARPFIIPSAESERKPLRLAIITFLRKFSSRRFLIG